MFFCILPQNEGVLRKKSQHRRIIWRSRIHTGVRIPPESQVQMIYEEAAAYLKSVEQYGSILGLNPIRKLMDALGHPEQGQKIIHVAGTNGKGSTAALISGMLAAGGFRVGRFISPAVQEFWEIIQIETLEEGRLVSRRISNEQAAKQCSIVREAADRISPHPTVFEIETAMAFLYFKEKKCDYVVLEVGLGGRLDATNVIEHSEIAVLTSISRDHMQYLGETIEEIASEKAGIIKPQGKTVTVRQDPRVLDILEREAIRNTSALTVCDPNKAERISYSLTRTRFDYHGFSYEIGLLGTNQIENAVLALEAVRLLNCVRVRDMQFGLAHTVWNGRFQILHQTPLLIVDGAHNEGAARALRENIQVYLSGKRLIYIMGVFKDKEYEKVLQLTAEFASAIVTLTPKNPRALPSADLAECARHYCSCVYDGQTLSGAMVKALELAREEDVILAFGSLSFLGELINAAENCR